MANFPRVTPRNAISVQVFDSAEEAARVLAGEVAELIRSRAAVRRTVVLGLATGSSPLPFYRELIRLHREDGLSFSNVVTFNLDEYLGLGCDHPRSYWSFMHRVFFDHVDMRGENIHLPPGLVVDEEIEKTCAAYEAEIGKAGGIDFQLLGIGRAGHIGFNEAGSPKDSRTRKIHLDQVTREDAAAGFGGLDQVPEEAITMGCATILAARRIALLAWGREKAAIVKEAIEGPVTEQVCASFLQEHADTTFYLDRGAAGTLA